MKRKVGTVAAVVGTSAMLSGLAAAAASPSVVTGGTSSITQHSAVLHGTVNPNGSSTTYFFQWGLTNQYGVNGKPLSAGSGTTAVSVHQTPGNLIPGTVYHYRLVATNKVGTSVGADRTFKTAGHPPPGVTTGPATQLSSSGATLTGAVNPAGETTNWYFQWGTVGSLSQQTAPQTLGAKAPAQSVSWSLQGLLHPGTIYQYRLVATHPGSATSVGADGEFMTYPTVRPYPRVTAATRPLRDRHAPYVLTTSGAIVPPSSIPQQWACTGNVTIRFFRGLRQIGFTMAGVQPSCRFAAQTVFRHLRRPGPARLRIVVRLISTHYLASNRARVEHVTLG